MISYMKCGKERREGNRGGPNTEGIKQGKGRWVGECCRKEKGGCGRKGGFWDTGAEEHSLLQGLHSHFLILQLLLHLGQLLLQSGELRTQGRVTGLPWRTMGFSHHHHRSKVLSHDCSHTGMLCCVYTETHVHIHTHTHSGFPGNEA